MYKVGHKTLIVLSGLVWLIVGCVLLPLGLNFLVESILMENRHLKHPLLDTMTLVIGEVETAILLIIGLALFIGYCKSRYVLSKSVKKSVERIAQLPPLVPISRIYTLKYYILLAVMIGLGFIFKFAPFDIRGAVDVIIGSALINGAIQYFRYALHVKNYSYMV
jgi:hypothetical protein